MAERIHEVFEAALGLPIAARTELVARLLESLETEREEPADVQRAWAAEVVRRQQAFAAGEVELAPWDVVRARVGGTR